MIDTNNQVESQSRQSKTIQMLNHHQQLPVKQQFAYSIFDLISSTCNKYYKG